MELDWFHDGRLLSLVEKIYAGAAAPDLWPEVMADIAGLFGDTGCIMVYNRDDASLGTIVSPSLRSAEEEYQREWWKYDLRSQRIENAGYATQSVAITDHQIASEEEIAHHPFYTRFLRPRDMGRFAATSVSPRQGTFLALSVQRSFRKPVFSQSELSLVTYLGRHVEASLRLGLKLLRAELVETGLNAVFSKLGVGLFLLGPSCNLLFANDVADRAIGDAVIVRNGKLRARHVSENRILEEHVSCAARHGDYAVHGSARVMVLHGQDAGMFYAAYVQPFVGPAGFNAYLSGVRVALITVASTTSAALDPTIIRDLFGVTLGEARVAALVANGQSPREAAEALGIKEETSRTVLKRVYSKVGVTRQSELTRLLTRLLMT